MVADLKTRVVKGNRNYLQVNASPNAVLASDFFYAPAGERIRGGQELSALPPGALEPLNITPKMLFANEDGNKTLIEIPELVSMSGPKESVRLVSNLATEPEREWLRQYRFRDQRPEGFASIVGDPTILSIPNIEGSDNAAAIMQQLPDDASLPAIEGFGNVHNNALIKIRHKSSTSSKWSTCVGTHLGNGRVLTARHCLNDDYLFQFGVLSVKRTRSHNPNNNFPDTKGVLECVGDGETIEHAFKLPDGDHLDVAILSLPNSFMTMMSSAASQFQNAKFDIHPNRSDPKTFLGPEYFALITIWNEPLPNPIAYDASGTLVKPEKDQRVVFRHDPEKTNTFNCQNHHLNKNFQKCAKSSYFNGSKLGNISTKSWLSGCPATRGTSGSPIFDATDSTRIVAVVSADGRDTGTCLAPVYFPENQ